MTGSDFQVPPKSWGDIAGIAARLRSKFGLADAPHFPVMRLLENVLCNKLNVVQLIVQDCREMGAAEGYTDPAGRFIILREDVYDGAWAGDGRSRFTVAHELGHLVMHTRIPLARVGPQDEVKPFMLGEPQANQFAACILMPRKFFSAVDTPEVVLERHGVSFEAAKNRLKYLKKNGVLR